MLQKENRLSTTYEYNKTRRLGQKVSSPLFDVFYLKIRDYEGPPRIGVVTSNLFSPIAPVRNRVKRHFREVLRLNIDKVPNGYWVVVHPRRVAIDKTYEEISTEINKALSKIPFAN